MSPTDKEAEIGADFVEKDTELDLERWLSLRERGARENFEVRDLGAILVMLAAEREMAAGERTLEIVNEAAAIVGENEDESE